MSAETEYLLRSKYNRALNKIARLEEQLAKTTRAQDVGDEFNPDVERRDAEILQEQVFLLRRKLDEVSAERDEALRRLGDSSRAAINAMTEPSEFVHEGRLIQEIEDNLSILKKKLAQAPR